MRPWRGRVRRAIRRATVVLACGVAVLVGVSGVAGLVPAPAQAIQEGISERLQEGVETVGRLALEKQEQLEVRQAQEQTDARQRSAREASEREADALALRERSEEEAHEREQAAVCVVPRLDGKTLRQARVALARAHCALGHVRRPRRLAVHLVVVAQRVRPGRSLTHGAAIAVTLGGSANGVRSTRPPPRRTRLSRHSGALHSLGDLPYPPSKQWTVPYDLTV